jgi:CheY-like chemotaxis protein
MTEINKPLKIMIVDDTPEDLYITNRIVTKYGNDVEVVKFELGIFALEYLVTNKNDLNNIPDIIFLDIHMPMMSGFDFMDEFTKLPEDIKKKAHVYILSSSFDPQDMEKAAKDPLIKKFIEKPLNKDLLFEILANN